ncbi:hypothetical protein BDC45DRAFT_563591 [Circinella umbellata]|nr:hypothetical protein BDC45DRAFT_563591 [Circinella umbellata]
MAAEANGQTNYYKAPEPLKTDENVRMIKKHVFLQLVPRMEQKAAVVRNSNNTINALNIVVPLSMQYNKVTTFINITATTNNALHTLDNSNANAVKMRKK